MINIIGSVFAVGRALHSLVKGNCKLEFPLYLFPLDLPPVPGNIVRGSAPPPLDYLQPLHRRNEPDLLYRYVCAIYMRETKANF